jgi:hypothetical protein
MGWLKRLFGILDRGDAAAERVAVALEGIAGDLEEVRARLRQRFGLEDAAPAAVPALALEDHGGNGEAPPAKKNGRRRVGV